MSNYSLTTEVCNDIFIVRSNGYLDEHGGAALFELFKTSLPPECNKIIFNLQESPVINSQGISRLIEISEIIVDDKGGQIAFVGLNPVTHHYRIQY